MSTPKHRLRQAPIALDAFRARANRAYAQEKLSFIERFVPPALTVDTTMPDRVYVDLFAGPGRNVDLLTRDESDGACLGAIAARGPAAPRSRMRCW